jgi:hypothetical protein
MFKRFMNVFDPIQLSLGTRIGYEISRKRPDVEGSVSCPCMWSFLSVVNFAFLSVVNFAFLSVSNFAFLSVVNFAFLSVVNFAAVAPSAHVNAQVSLSTPALEKFGVGANKCDLSRSIPQHHSFEPLNNTPFPYSNTQRCRNVTSKQMLHRAWRRPLPHQLCPSQVQNCRRSRYSRHRQEQHRLGLHELCRASRNVPGRIVLGVM